MIMGKFDNFEYAGKNSGIYNLVLCEINKDYKSLISGAEYEPSVDTLPRSANQLLLGLDYSNKPLEFDLEIINPDENIPYTQVEEIKDWLFGQNGWKKFVLINERQDYYLRALLIPSEDIMDVNGYRGFRCKLRNDSGFWYKNERIDLPLSYTDGINQGISTITKTIKLKNIPDRIEINPMVSFSTVPLKRSFHTDTICCLVPGQLTITNQNGTPEYEVVADDNAFSSKISGTYDSETNIFTATDSSRLVVGTYYSVAYWLQENASSQDKWNEGTTFLTKIMNKSNGSAMALDGDAAEFSIVADCKYGTYQKTLEGTTTLHNLKYPPFIDDSTKYSNLLYLSRGENVIQISTKLTTNLQLNKYSWGWNYSDIMKNNKIIFSFVSPHRIGGF